MAHRPCSKCGRTTTGKYCSQCKADRPAYRKLYENERWRRLSKAHRTANPYCAECARQGRVTLADVTDHIEPHRGDEQKFWLGPFESLCARCHNVKTRKEQSQNETAPPR